MRKGEKKRSQQVILYNSRQIAKAYLQGKNQTEIAEEVGLSQPLVGRELESLRVQWVASTEIDFAEAQGAALRRIDDLESEAISQYLKSKQPKKIITKKKEPVIPKEEKPSEVDNKGNIIPPMPTRQFIVVEETIRSEKTLTADVRWHDQIMKCVDMRLKVLGLYKQHMKEVPNGGFVPVGITKETAKSKVALFLAIIKEWDEASQDN